MMSLTETGMSYGSLIFDGATILIILVFLIINVKRGFSKTFISVIGYILAILLGSIISDVSAEPTYDSVLSNQIVANVEEVLDKHSVASSICDRIKKDTFGVVISQDKLSKVVASSGSLYNAINGKDNEFLSMDKINTLLGESVEDAISSPLKNVLPSPAVDYMINSLKSNSDLLYTTVPILLQDNKSAAEYIEQTFIKPIVLYIIKMAIFFVVFLIVMIIVKIISKTIENNDSLPTIAVASDRLLGAILGIAEGMILLILISVVVKLLVYSSGGTSEIFSSEVIQSTKLFKTIYNLDIIKMFTNG